MELKALERALSDSKKVTVDSAYLILKVAVENFLAAQKKTHPTTQTKPGHHDHSEFFKRIEELTKDRPQGCPNCGMIGAHYCVGRRYPHPYGIGTGIEYWYNQPSSVCNMEVYNGSKGIQIGTSVGSSRS